MSMLIVPSKSRSSELNDCPPLPVNSTIPGTGVALPATRYLNVMSLVSLRDALPRFTTPSAGLAAWVGMAYWSGM